MDLQKDLEEYKRTCKLRGDAIVELEEHQKQRYDEDKEIIIQNLDFCRYKLEHISVKDIPNEVEACREGMQEGFKIDIENPTDLPIIKDVHSKTEKFLENDRYSSSPGRPPSHPEFLKDNEIPNQDRTKVYDFEMSKNLTLPKKLSQEDALRLRRKWVIIGSLVSSTALLVVLVTLVLIFN